MLITFQCPGCNANLEIEADAAGTQLECPECNARVTVPRPGIGPGVTIGGFKILKLLGTGGMGEVYLARQLSMDRDVALKILPGHLTLHKEPVERFLQEVRLLAKLDHPNIVTAHEAGEDGGVYFMAMAYVSGDPLNIKLDRDGPMPEKPALRLVLKIARALAYAWSEHRLIHRDIKPGNIMLDKHGEPRLMDLGLSKSLTGTAMTLSAKVIGTPNYMSPEQAEAREVDFRSDMYSLGATLHHMLTGQVPFEGSSIVEVLRKQATESLPDPRSVKPEISDACVALLEIMLAKDPAQRHGDWAALTADIDRVLAGHPPTRAPLKPGESILLKIQARASPPGEEHKRIVLTHAQAQELQNKVAPSTSPPTSRAPLVLGAVAVLLAAGIGIYVVSRRDQPAPAAMEPTDEAPATAAVERVEADRLRIETLAGQYAEAEKYSEEHSQEYAQIRSRFERIAQDGAGTEFGEKAAASLQRLEDAEQRAVDEAMAQIEARAESLYDEGRTGEAIESVRGYAGPWAERTKDRRRDLSDRLARRSEEAREAASKQDEAAQAAMDRVVDEVAAALFREDIAAAEAVVAAASRDEALRPMAETLADVRNTVAAVAEMPKRILDSFRDETGREVAIDFKAGPQTVKIVSVGPTEVKAQIRFSAGFAALDITADGLSFQEKFKRLEGQDAQMLGILRGLLLVQARKPAAAPKYFREAGTPFGEALAAQIDRRMAGEREVEAGKALAGLLALAGMPAGAGVADEVVLKVRRTVYPPADIVRIRKAAVQFRQAYGNTEKAKQASALLTALDRVDTFPRYLEPSQLADLVKRLEQANPQFKARPSIYNPADDTGIALDLSGNPELTDISPLKGLPLTRLILSGTGVADLSPLKGMPLEYLNLSGCKVSDLKPLAESPLKKLNLDQCPVESLQDISGLQLKELSLWKTQVFDLKPLRRMPLTYLNIVATYVGDLNPIADLPLQTLCLGWTQAFGGAPARESMPDKWWAQLKQLNMPWNGPRLKQSETDGIYIEIENTDVTKLNLVVTPPLMLYGAKALTISFKYRSTMESSSPWNGSWFRVRSFKEGWVVDLACEATNTWTEVKKTVSVPAFVDQAYTEIRVDGRIGKFDVKDIRFVAGDGSEQR